MNNPTIQITKGPIKGYKAFKKDVLGLYTNGLGQGEKVLWKKGDRKQIKGELLLCINGYHFFTSLCFALDYLEKGNDVYKIIAHGSIVSDTFKSITDDIEIIKKITKKEIKKLIKKNYNSGYYNSGHRNSGHRNSGNHNSGNHNSGDYNSGNHNSGHRNSGDYNSGDYNSGYHNSGDYNSGYYNSGNHNSGHRNSGDYNSGDYNSGYHNSGDYNSGYYNSGNGYINYFCTQTKYFLFDVEVKKIPSILQNLNMSWFHLTEKNRQGYLKAWKECPRKVLDIFRSIPEFQIKKNKIKFKEITGLDL